MPISAVIDTLVKPQYKDTEQYKKFVTCTTTMFAENWFKSMLLGIKNSGVKTRLGRTAIIAVIGHTGGDPKLYAKSLLAGRFYVKVEKSGLPVDHFTSLEPAVAGADKEVEWVKEYFSHWKKDDYKGNLNKAAAFVDYANRNETEPTVWKSKPQKDVVFGQFDASLAPEEEIILSVIKKSCGDLLNVIGGSPSVGTVALGEGGTIPNVLIPNCDVFIDPGHTRTNSRGGPEENKKYPWYFAEPFKSFIEKRLSSNGKPYTLSPQTFKIEHDICVMIGTDLYKVLTKKGLKVSYADYPEMTNSDEIGRIERESVNCKPKVFIALHLNAGKANYTLCGYKPNEPRFAESVAKFISAAGFSAKPILADPKAPADEHGKSPFNVYPGTLRVQRQPTKSVYMESFFYDNKNHMEQMIKNYDKFISALANAIITNLR